VQGHYAGKMKKKKTVYRKEGTGRIFLGKKKEPQQGKSANS